MFLNARELQECTEEGHFRSLAGVTDFSASGQLSLSAIPQVSRCKMLPRRT